MTVRLQAVSYILLLLYAVSCKQKETVDHIIYDATVYTVDSVFSVQQAIAVKNGKIIAVGSNAGILQSFQSALTEKATGKFIYPGLIDAHCHFTGYATDMWKCDLTGTASFDAVLDRLKSYAATATTQWLYGRGWDQNDWPEKTFPDKTKLDSLFPDRPVFLKRIDGHAVLVNQKALDIAGITAALKVPGGSIEVKSGKLTGMLIDNAMDLAEKAIPLISDAEAMRYFKQAQDSCFQYGITGVHDCGISEHTVDLVDAAQTAGALYMKIFALLSDSTPYYQRWLQRGVYKTELLHVGGFKLYADGALGSRGACLLQPYSDKPGWNGFLLSATEHFNEVAALLARSNFQMCTHAIGDSANRKILSAYAAVLKEKNDKRWRIEHAQVVNETDFIYFNNFSIVPSVQPTHATSDMYWAGERLGKTRIKNGYAYKKLLAQNGWIALGTDFPVEDINPFKTFYAAVVRKDSNGYPKTGFQTENALTRKEALQGMTIWAAKAAFEEREKGSLEKGKAADFFVCDKDLMKTGDETILQTKVSATFVNGKKIYSR